jgi:Thioredoxin
MTATSEQVEGNGSRTRRTGPDRPILCFFYSPTSGPSRRVEAFLAQVLQRRQNHRTFALQRVDCDKYPELVERYAVTQMPTLIVIEGRRVLGRLEGSCGCRKIEKLLEPWLNREAERAPVEDGTGWSPRAAAAAPHAMAAVSSTANESLGEGLVHPVRDGRARTPYTPVGLSLPASLSFERWQALGRRIGSITNASSWWLGDWAFYGQGSYGEKYKQAIEVTGLDHQTLRNYAWVAGRFDLSRRRDNLSFAHHAEVAALLDEEQDEWLDLAERSRWSRNELRARLRKEKPARIPSEVELVRLNVDAARVQRWKAAADAASLDLTEWLVAAADDAACRVPSAADNGSRPGRRARARRVRKLGRGSAERR